MRMRHIMQEPLQFLQHRGDSHHMGPCRELAAGDCNQRAGDGKRAASSLVAAAS